MSKLSSLSLEELYAQPKITPSTRKYILLKEEFSSIKKNWCNKVCRVTHKELPNDDILKDLSEVDVLIISDFVPIPDKKYKKTQQELKHTEEAIIGGIARRALGQGISFSVVTLTKCQTEEPQTQLAMLDCTPYLKQQIELTKPKVIISLSTTTSKALDLKVSNSSDAGKIFYYKDIPVIITLHPRILTMVRQNQSGALWGADYYSVILTDFKKAVMIVKDKVVFPTLEEAIEKVKKRVHVCQTLEHVSRLAAYLKSNSSIKSFDIETTGLDPYAPDAAILCAQFGFRDADGDYTSVVVPLFHPKCPPPYDPEEAWQILVPVLTDPEVFKVGHNIKFDVKYVAVVKGVRVQGVKFDTMLLMHSINSGLQGLYSLKTAVGYYLPETGLMGYEDLLHQKK